MDHSILVPERALGPVFCDWLTVTCHPESSFVHSSSMFLDGLGATQINSRGNTVKYGLPGGGTVQFSTQSNYHSISLSGSALGLLRDSGVLSQFLSLLAEVSYTVTRLDAACDYSLDGPDVIEALEMSFPGDLCNLSRKALRVTRFKTRRKSDNRETGTWYAGHRQKAQVTARIYDKTHELIEKKKLLFSDRPITRVELTASKNVGATLRDAYEPESLYYHLGSPTFFSRPAAVSAWVPGGDFVAWSSTKPPELYPASLVKTKIEFSPDISRIADLVSGMGEEGVQLALRLLERRIRACLAA